MELGKQIKKHRQEVQLSQEKLADRVYVSRQTISNWENEPLWKNLVVKQQRKDIVWVLADILIKKRKQKGK